MTEPERKDPPKEETDETADVTSQVAALSEHPLEEAVDTKIKGVKRKLHHVRRALSPHDGIPAVRRSSQPSHPSSKE